MTPHRDPARPPLAPTRPGSATRHLLRALRDLNSSCRLAVRGDLAVALEGCLSLDGPVEQGVRYRLRLEDGSERLLSIRAGTDGLEVTVHSTPEGRIERALRAELHWDDRGHAVAPDLRARWSHSRPGSRPTEHFLRRLVRGVYAA